MARYSETIDRVLRAEGLLGALRPADILDRELWRAIRDASDDSIAEKKPIADADAFRLVRGGLLYVLDDLEGSHRIFQDAAGDLGAYWHGMVHRREGDFDNARYWFRRSGQLPFFAELHRLSTGHSAEMARQPGWDPYLFTGQAEQERFGAEDQTAALVALQRAEFEVFFDYCWRQAKVG